MHRDVLHLNGIVFTHRRHWGRFRVLSAPRRPRWRAKPTGDSLAGMTSWGRIKRINQRDVDEGPTAATSRAASSLLSAAMNGRVVLSRPKQKPVDFLHFFSPEVNAIQDTGTCWMASGGTRWYNSWPNENTTSFYLNLQSIFSFQ